MARVLMIKTRIWSDRRLHYGITPPLGLMSLAAYARKERPGKDDFQIVDERIAPLNDQQYSDVVVEFRPDVLAVSSMSIESTRLTILLDLLKNIAPDTPVIVGGPYPSSVGKKIYRSAQPDYVVMGEGEKTFVRLLEWIDRGEPSVPEGIPGVISRRMDGTLSFFTPLDEFLEPHDIPMPAWDLVNPHEYSTTNRMTPYPMSESYAPLFTSRGCPFGCIYCHNIFGRKFRAKGPLQVVDEIEHLITQYKIHSFEIVDDIFNLDYDRVMEICAEIKRRGLKTSFSFPNAVRGDLMDERMIQELKSVGTYHMAIAVESTSPRIQKMIHKNLQVDKVRKNIEIASQEGIFTWGFFMLGFPTETRKEIWETIRFALKSRLHGASFFLVIPQEGTKMAELFGTRSSNEPVSYAHDYYFSSNSISCLSGRELDITHFLAFILFFFDPRRMIRILLSFPASKIQLPIRAIRMSWLLLFKLLRSMDDPKPIDGTEAKEKISRKSLIVNKIAHCLFSHRSN